MTWRLRHEGSPQPVPHPLSTEQILEGLKDEVYSPTDEVRGPGDTQWERLEKHPYFAETVDLIEESLEEFEHEPDDSHIDMNPLIDVCLVLLVFFILATTLQIMEKVLALPKNLPPSDKKYIMKEEDAKRFAMLTLEQKNGATVFKVNEYEATNDEVLLRELETLVKNGKSEIILEVKPGVPFESYTRAIDAATTARVTKVMTKATQKQLRGAPAPAKK